MVMRRLTILLVAIALTLLLAGGAAYGAAPPFGSPTIAAHPSMTAQVAPSSALSWSPVLGIASATAGAGVVQGHVSLSPPLTASSRVILEQVGCLSSARLPR